MILEFATVFLLARNNDSGVEVSGSNGMEWNEGAIKYVVEKYYNESKVIDNINFLNYYTYEGSFKLR